MWCVLWAVMSVPPVNADYISPREAGFHHCVLIYDSERRGPDGLLPLVAHLSQDGAPGRWLFDAYLVIPHYPGPSSNSSYHTGPTDRADWEALLDGWFSERYGFSALQAAIDSVRETLGAPPQPIQAIITIPYPCPEQTHFGDVNGDGIEEDLSNAQGREAAIAWFLDQALARWQAADPADLRLWGFYWVHEGIGAGDSEIVKRTARAVHERGYRFLWIPYFRATGFEAWQEFGFDVAILQPNYAFLSQHRGEVRNDRLIETAALAHRLGMGVEMEVGYTPDTDIRVRDIFRDYLAFGRETLCGYQSGAMAYFQSLQVFPNLYHAQDPDARHAYDELAAFLRGEEIDRPGWLRGAAATVMVGGRDEPAPELVDDRFVTHLAPDAQTVELGERQSTIAIELPEPRPIGEIELSMLRGTASWSGIIAAEIQGPGTDVWEPAGWLKTALPAVRLEGHRKYIAAVPAPTTEVGGIRLRVAQPDPPTPVRVDEVSVTRWQELPDRATLHLARACPYRVEPDAPRRYPDTGTRLTDGEVSKRSWTEGLSVGWFARDVTVNIDLGSVRVVDGAVVHCDGGGTGAVHFPQAISAEFTQDGPPPRPGTAGYGTPPKPAQATVTVGRDDVALTGGQPPQGGESLASGSYQLRPPRPVAARYVALYFRPQGWLMVSEVEVLSDGRNIASEATYAVLPRPTADAEAKYADDGLRLTDGHVARRWEPAAVSGWANAPSVSLVVDLGHPIEVREVTAHALGGGLYGIFAPAGVALELSPDGAEFREVAAAAAVDPENGTCEHLPVRLILPEGQQARFIRLALRPLKGWLMLSEVEVH
jgi:hypothetical protein